MSENPKIAIIGAGPSGIIFLSFDKRMNVETNKVSIEEIEKKIKIYERG